MVRKGSASFLAAAGFVALLSTAACVTPEDSLGGAVSQALREAAADASARRDFAGAADRYGKLLERAPADRDAAIGYLDSLRHLAAFDQASQAIVKVKESLAGDPGVLVAAAKLQLAAGKAAEALADLDTARSADPRNWEIYSLTGVALDSQGNYQAAAAAYRAGLELSPGNPVLLNNLALSLAQAGRLDEAIRILQDLLASRQKVSPQIRQNLAMLHGFRGNLKEFEILARTDLKEEAVRKNLEAFRALQAGSPRSSP